MQMLIFRTINININTSNRKSVYYVCHVIKSVDLLQIQPQI